MKTTRFMQYAAFFLMGYAITSRGEVVVQSRSIDPHLPSASRALSFDQCSTDFTLRSIEIIFTTWMHGGRIEWDNDSEESASVGGTIGMRASLTSSDVNLNDGLGNPWLNMMNVVTATIVAGPTTGDVIGEFNRTGDADHVVLSGPGSGAAKQVTVSGQIAPEHWGAFMGSGTLAINYRDWQSQSSWSDGATYSVSAPSAGSGSVSLIYTAVPEPQALMLMGCSGLLAFCRMSRRRRG